MPRIKILPEHLSNKIAAGEVVERPASVVKELVENALDAGSDRIFIDVEKGGRSLIRVSDNGSGMRRDDALLSIERYATSKIYKDPDLFSIHTLGFRGEALPSIASVSRFSLVTRDQAAHVGTEIVIQGGTLKKVSEVGAPEGTMITVAQLFFNTPARRKFLKSIGTEMGHIADTVSRIALGRPDARFRLSHNDKILKDWPLAPDPFDRVVDVLGSDLQKELHPIHFKGNDLTVSGWISSPRVTRSTSRGLYAYVNGRFVRDRVIQHALFEGYSQRLVKGQFPVAAVFVQIPFDQVDVNVHPTKNEVRFQQQRNVHETVKRAVYETLNKVDRLQWAPSRYPQGDQYSKPGRISEGEGQQFGIRPPAPGVLRPGGNSEFGNKKREVGLWNYKSAADDPHRESSIEHPASSIQHQRDDTRRRQSPLWQEKHFSDLRIIGQLHNTYVVCEGDEGLILIDQHAAHERVLFEQLSRRSTAAQRAAQQLLVAETIELGYREAGILEQMIPALKDLGLDIEPFGGNSFIVKALPGLLAGREAKPLIIEIVEKVAAVGFSSGLDAALDECREVMACHGAIRANQALTDKQISALLDQLDECENPSHCPHGRPTWIRWDLRTLEKSFKRII